MQVQLRQFRLQASKMCRLTREPRRKKPDPQQVQQIKSQHANFRAQPKPQQVPAVTFNQNYRIEESDHWPGRPVSSIPLAYHPEWHDQGWYHSHYNRVELIGGGYYFFNAFTRCPASSGGPSAQYYAYDGPIYGGQRAEPPDKVIADVQAVLQQIGYNKGEVDGLLGPLTREALTAYQANQGLTTDSGNRRTNARFARDQLVKRLETLDLRSRQAHQRPGGFSLWPLFFRSASD